MVDVDGTLVDSNYQHVVCWFRAFVEYGVTVPMWRIHRAIGMGGDELSDAGALRVYDDLATLRADLSQLPFSKVR